MVMESPKHIRRKNPLESKQRSLTNEERVCRQTLKHTHTHTLGSNLAKPFGVEGGEDDEGQLTRFAHIVRHFQLSAGV